MTPHEIQLIKKLEEQVNNLAHILAGTQAGESQALSEIKHCLFELKKEAKEKADQSMVQHISLPLPNDIFPDGSGERCNPICTKCNSDLNIKFISGIIYGECDLIVNSYFCSECVNYFDYKYRPFINNQNKVVSLPFK